MSRGVKMMADIPIEEARAQEWDLVALPGGMPGKSTLVFLSYDIVCSI